MKKLCTLIKASMTEGMNIFKIKSNKNRSNLRAIVLITILLMFSIWSNANMLYEKITPMHMQFVVLIIGVFSTSLMTIIEGIYKSSSLLFNAKDDDLLLSLPIKRSTVLFIRIFKFYLFELLFNSIFLIPIIISYIRWADSINYTYYLTSTIMIFILPIIPIIISSIIGFIVSSISSRFKYKNLMQIIISMAFIIVILFASFNLENFYSYLANNVESINNLITKIYYPAYIYGKLVVNFNLSDLLIFILVNILIFGIGIYILSKFYFNINSRLKRVTTSKSINIDKMSIKSNSIYKSLIKKELNVFFKTPVFIINAGLGLALYIISTIIISIKFNSIIPVLINQEGMNISKDLIMNNLSIFILILILITGFMTSITSSVISLEGKYINILKSLPIKTKTILMSKIYSSLVLTTPVLIIGNIILIIKFKISIVESLLILILSILIPLVSHFIGLMVNLKYPKLEFESTTEVVKQSTSSFISVTLGMLLLIINIAIVLKLIKIFSSIQVLFMVCILYIIINTILYLLLINIGIKKFNKLTI